MSLVVEGWVNRQSWGCVGGLLLWKAQIEVIHTLKSEALGTVTTSERGFAGRLERLLTHGGKFV